MIAGKLQPWLAMDKISDEIMSDYDVVEESGLFGSNFKFASIGLCYNFCVVSLIEKIFFHLQLAKSYLDIVEILVINSIVIF